MAVEVGCLLSRGTLRSKVKKDVICWQYRSNERGRGGGRKKKKGEKPQKRKKRKKRRVGWIKYESVLPVGKSRLLVERAWN